MFGEEWRVLGTMKSWGVMSRKTREGATRSEELTFGRASSCCEARTRFVSEQGHKVTRRLRSTRNILQEKLESAAATATLQTLIAHLLEVIKSLVAVARVVRLPLIVERWYRNRTNIRIGISSHYLASVEVRDVMEASIAQDKLGHRPVAELALFKEVKRVSSGAGRRG